MLTARRSFSVQLLHCLGSLALLAVLSESLTLAEAVLKDDEAKLTVLLKEQEDQEKSEAGGSRAKSACLRAGPLRRIFKSLQVFRTINEPKATIRKAETLDQVKQVLEDLKTPRQLYLALAKSVTVACDDVRAASLDWKKREKKRVESAAKEEAAAKKRRDENSSKGGRPSIRPLQQFYEVDFSEILQPESPFDQLLLDLKQPFIMAGLDTLRAFVDSHEGLRRDIADFGHHFKQSSARITSGRGQRRVLDNVAADAFCEAVAANTMHTGLTVAG